MIAWLKAEVGRAPVLYGALLVVAASWAAYANSLDSTFHYDDGHHIVENPFLRHPQYAGRYFSDPDLFSALPGHRMYRPMVLLSYALNYSWGGYDPLPWRLTAIALHSLAALGVFLTGLVLAGRLGRPAPAGLAGPLVAALFFALHPAFTESVDYASARSSLLAAAFTVWAFLLHRLALGSRRRGPRLALWTGSLLLFGCGLLSKEIAIVFPALLLLAAWIDRRGYAAVFPSALLACLYLVVRHLVLGTAVVDFAARSAAMATADPGSGGARPMLWNLWTQVRVVASYVLLFAWPFGLCVNREVRVSRTPFEPGVLLAGLFLLALTWLAWRHRRRRPMAALGWAWFLVALAPTSLIPLNQVMNEHRMYLPGLGIAFALAGLAQRLRPRHAPLVGVAAAGLLALTLQRNEDWRDPVRLWQSAVDVSPDSDGSWNALGVQRRVRGEYDAAIAAFERARVLNPSSWSPVFNLGTLHLQRGHERDSYGDLEEAERRLLQSLEIQPGSERSRWYLAETWNVMGRVEKAEDAFRSLAGLNPRLFEMTRYPLARMAMDRGELDRAEEYYRDALKEGRDPVAALLGLAEVALQREDRAAALGRAAEAMEERPWSPHPHLFLARVHRGTALAAHHLFEAERRGYRPAPGERDSFLRGGAR